MPMGSSQWTSRLRVPSTAAALSAAVVVAAGCGGGSQPLSREELITKGDALCREAAQRFAEIQAQRPATANEAADQTDELIDVSKDEVDGLRELDPPDDLKPSLERYIAAREAVIEVFERGRDAAENQDARAYGAAQKQVGSGEAERYRLARAVGFTECSGPSRRH